MKKSFKQFEAILLGIIFMFSFFSPITIQAEQEEKTSFPMYVIHKTGNDNENFVILIMGDGYTADQQEQFIKDAADKANGMLKWSPYKEFSDKINIYAMQVVSAESGLGELYGDGPDTYFNLRAYGSIIGFTNGGETKARALRSEIENNYLDEGALVGTTHIISNSTVNLAVSSGVAFSFSTNASQNSTGTTMTHEISHSIGKLGDEYSNKTNYPNISNTADADSIKWSKLLGFGGVGITNAGTSSVFAPSTECMMRELGRDFCEVCKMELAWKLNNTDFVKYPAKKMYVANPEITLEHNRISTLGSQIEKYRITEKNITKANNQDIEFRTVVQNMENRERHLKISLDILASDGKTVKFSNEKEYTVPALTNSYSPNDARESLSVKLTPEYLTYGDKISGKIIDTDTGEVLATDKTASQKWGEIHIRFKSKSSLTDIPNTATTTVYAPINSTYTLRNPEISGYTLVGNSVGGNSVKITEANTDVTYYYRDKNSSHTHTWSDWEYNNDAEYNSKTDYTDGTATRTCTECGEDETKTIAGTGLLRANTASVILDASVTLNIGIDKSRTSPFESSFIRIEFGGESYDLTEPSTKTTTDRTYYDFDKISPDKFADEVTITPYGMTSDGIVCKGHSVTYSIKNYCYTQLNKTPSQNLKALLVELLYYGEEYQKYRGYNTDNLVTSDLTDEQKKLHTTDNLEYSNVTNSKYRLNPNGTNKNEVAFKSASMLLEGKVIPRIKVEISSEASISDYTFRWTVDGQNTEFTYAEHPDWFTQTYGSASDKRAYYVDCTILKANQFSTPFYLTVFKDGTQVSNMLQYSVESYATGSTVKNNVKLKSLIDQMLRYGRAEKIRLEQSV